ncbi:hypothetical protein [Alicyclobacillus fastidiosus]|uniref:hypothetical protein n=1 Tax=Alicyclobacillus fastidiosus TaxID=392011 RepID=UPI0023E90D47|nr:hypothetical protein [Alicyclobacillus fastidiosus]GMA63177.1 hypothetical protein GCM10025859_36170 [Alicyclobacillus fastidiosus]
MFNRPTYDLRDPFPWYEYMRSNQPVWQEDSGAWHVFRHDDVKRVLSDHESFSSQRGTTDDPSNPISASLISSDPPRHRQLRTLVSQAFTPALSTISPGASNRLRRISSMRCHRGILRSTSWKG